MTTVDLTVSRRYIKLVESITMSLYISHE